jgi:protein TonB
VPAEPGRATPPVRGATRSGAAPAAEPPARRPAPAASAPAGPQAPATPARPAASASDRSSPPGGTATPSAAPPRASGAAPAALAGTRLARAEPAATAGGSAGASYAALVIAAIERAKIYPAAAEAQGLEGRVVVSFTIGPDGRTATASLARSSGVPVLDQAAITLVERLRLPPPPGGHFALAPAINYRRR